MFILCKGDLAKEPYVIPVSGVSVYSLEELCYYIYNNIYSVTEEFFDSRLAVWLREQVHEEGTAQKMRVLIERHNSLTDLVVTLLCSCDYYKEDEVRKLVEVMDAIANLPPHKKNKIKADNYLKAGRYGKSLQEYKKLLYGKQAEEFTTEEYGDLLHNQAIALYYVSSFHEAAQGFKEAYARNQRKESLVHYLYVLLLDGEEELFDKESLSFGMEPEEIEGLKQDYIDAKKECRVRKEELAFAGECRDELRTSFEGAEA